MESREQSRAETDPQIQRTSWWAPQKRMRGGDVLKGAIGGCSTQYVLIRKDWHTDPHRGGHVRRMQGEDDHLRAMDRGQEDAYPASTRLTDVQPPERHSTLLSPEPQVHGPLSGQPEQTSTGADTLWAHGEDASPPWALHPTSRHYSREDGRRQVSKLEKAVH